MATWRGGIELSEGSASQRPTKSGEKVHFQVPNRPVKGKNGQPKKKVGTFVISGGSSCPFAPRLKGIEFGGFFFSISRHH